MPPKVRKDLRQAKHLQHATIEGGDELIKQIADILEQDETSRGNERNGRAETRRVDRKRLLDHVKVKVERSRKGRTAVLFMIFTAFYISALILQRNCRDSEALVRMMRGYLSEATFRDPETFELKTLSDVATVEDVWMWHYYVFVPKLYASRHYNGNPLSGKERGTVLTFNRLTTGFRMSQRRVLNGTETVFCVPRPQYQAFTQNCYGKTFLDARLGDVDKAPFYSYDLKTKYDYMEERYEGDADANIGYFENFGIDRDNPVEVAQSRLRKLQTDMWINAGTAWLRTDFVTYNSNLGLFCFVKITFEFLPTGEIRTSFAANTMKGRLYQTPGDMLVAFCELVSVLLWVVFLIRRAIAWMRKFRDIKGRMPLKLLVGLDGNIQ